MHASGDSPCHLSAKHHVLGTCLLLMAPFRSMLLTLQGGPQRFAPRAHWVPVYPRSCDILTLHFHGALITATMSTLLSSILLGLRRREYACCWRQYRCWPALGFVRPCVLPIAGAVLSTRLT